MKLKINKEFAEKFNKRKEDEELQRLKAKYGDESKISSSSSSSESEDGEEKELDDKSWKGFFKMYAAVQSKDPRIYDPDYKFFDDHSEDDDVKEQENNSKQKVKKNKKEKPMFLKDYERKIITEREGKLGDDESESEIETNVPKSVSYFEHQELIKKSIQEATAEIDDDSEDDFFKPKVSSKEEKDKKEKDYLEWLKGQKDDIDEGLAKDLEPLKKMWADPGLDDGQKFLRDFILNERYKGSAESDLDEEEILREVDEDEKEFEAEELFARKVDFRFQEEDKEFLKSYPRTIGESFRNKDNRRAEKRQRVKERKDAEKQKETEELKRLKNLKRKEILEKLDKIKHITGNEMVDVTEQDLEDDFDDAKHDAVMQKLIGEDYYDQDSDGDGKPQFDKEDFDEDVNESCNEWNDSDHEVAKESLSSEEQELQPCHSKSERGKEKFNKRKSKFAEELEKLKQNFDPKEMTTERYIDEVLSRMDYEDKIGDTAFRFKYRNVVPCDYGLSVDEVLKAPDRELNSWVSVKKMSQYRTEQEEQLDVKLFKKKSGNIKKKLNILHSLRNESSASERKEPNATNSERDNQSLPQGKQKKKKHANGTKLESTEDDEFVVSKGSIQNITALETNCARNDRKKGKKRKRKNKGVAENSTECKIPHLEISDQCAENKPSHNLNKSKGSDNGDGSSEAKNITENSKGKSKTKNKRRSTVPTMSSDRLAAYGINEKKFKYVIQNKLHKDMKQQNM